MTVLTAMTAVLAGCGGPEGEDDTDLPAEEGTGNGQEREDDDHGEEDESNGDNAGDESATLEV